MTTAKKKITLKQLKENASVLAYNQKTQQYEPVVFQNGIKVDLDNSSFRRGIEFTPGDAPESTDNRLYALKDTSKASGGTLYFNGEIAGATTPAPKDATYIVVSAESKLANERVLTAGDGISLEDAGAGGAIRIADTTTDATYVIVGDGSGGEGGTSLTNYRVIKSGSDIDFTDAGAGGAFTIKNVNEAGPASTYELTWDYTTNNDRVYVFWTEKGSETNPLEASAVADGRNFRVYMIAPYDGEVLNVNVQAGDPGGTTGGPGMYRFSIHRNASDTEQAGVNVNVANFDTVYSGSFSGATFNKNDMLHFGSSGSADGNTGQPLHNAVASLRVKYDFTS